MVLDTIGTLAWPAVAVVALIVFRKQVTAKLQELRSVDAGGVKAAFEERLARKVAEPATLLVGPVQVDPSTKDGAAPDNAVHSGALVTERRALDLQDASKDCDAATRLRPPVEDPSLWSEVSRASRREAVEEIIRDSAAWGYDMAKLGFDERVPSVDWDSDGRPRIGGSDASILDPAVGTGKFTKTLREILRGRHRKELEDEVRRLRQSAAADREQPPLDPVMTAMTETALHDAEERLRRQYPDSRLLRREDPDLGLFD